MIFNYLDEEATNVLRPLIPDDVMQGDLQIITVSEEEGLRGFAVVEVEADDLARLKWLYVLENYRKQGYGSALIDYMKQQLEGTEDCVLAATYETGSEEADILDRIFVEAGFDLSHDNRVLYRGTREQLLNSPLMNGELDIEDRGDIYPLEDIEVDVLEDFLERNPECPATVQEILHSNGILSLAYGLDGRMTGLILISDTEDDGEYFASTVYYNDKDNPFLMLDFYHKAMTYIVKADDLVQGMTFAAEVEAQGRMLKKVFGDDLEAVSLTATTAAIGSY